ncbi:Serine/threonine-protein kinase PRR1 [Escovopsis weberi]|uniref:Serine/threonine-protein kinase PRR1 n=1 Tax=Escovopsis weberi TaxID=150374 RepID=A0A0M9VS30_ESCWE|nr:Serine/threonine-protein kinase PRR1 [Escovopsis weberi]
MGPQMKTASGGDVHIRREEILAEPLGLTASVAQPPTPPPSESSNDLGEGLAAPKHEYFEAHDRFDKKLRRWRSIRTVGQGTFSRVVLATSQMNVPDDIADASASSPAADTRLDRKALVAVKICEHGPLGGASEERVEMSLKRELEIMQTIHHPSLVNLKAFRVEPTRAILVLSYCPGGDLFEVATTHRRVLTPPLMKRIFAELVGAVSYLHEQMIVHRDIKLENVLVNLTPQELADPSTDWATYPYAVIALADLGLSRRIAPDEKLETRCGSEDYAAPEVIMGQPYDGLATDAWSLGVLLYAMLESRLPFDPHPRMNDSHRMRSRTSHRIARVDWRWLEFDGDDGDHDGSEAKFREHGLLGAMHITEGLLKRARSRWTLAKVSTEPWVREGMTIPGGLRHREEIGGAEVV